MYLKGSHVKEGKDCLPSQEGTGTSDKVPVMNQGGQFQLTVRIDDLSDVKIRQTVAPNRELLVTEVFRWRLSVGPEHNTDPWPPGPGAALTWMD